MIIVLIANLIYLLDRIYPLDKLSDPGFVQLTPGSHDIDIVLAEFVYATNKNYMCVQANIGPAAQNLNAVSKLGVFGGRWALRLIYTTIVLGIAP